MAKPLNLAVLAVLTCSVIGFGQSVGKTTYVSKCAGCHASDGSGNNTIGRSLKTPDIRPLVKGMSDEELRKVILNGRGKMPAIKKMDDDRIRQVVLYLRDVAAGNSESGAAASEPLPNVVAVYRAKCSSCHAQNGTGRTTMGKQLGVPDLTSAAAMSQADQEWARAITGGKGKMPAYAKDLTRVQVNQLVAYIRGLAGGAMTKPPTGVAPPIPVQPRGRDEAATATDSATVNSAAQPPESKPETKTSPPATTKKASPPARQMYVAKCAGCHSSDGSGTGTIGRSLKVPDLRSATVQGKSADQLAETVANGVGKMPAYKKKLTSEQIQTLVGYIRELGSKSH
jgi:mono/diheme cytochrome c family protein